MTVRSTGTCLYNVLLSLCNSNPYAHMAIEIPEIVRTISGKGVITIPEEFNSALQIVLYAQILRKPNSRSVNLTWNPDKTFYAHITFCLDDFVLYEYDMNFDSQMWIVHDGQSSQNLLSLICAYDGILDSFVSIGNLIGGVLSRTNLIKNHPYLRFVPNRIRFECFSSSAIVLTLKGTFLGICVPGDGDNSPPPPPPPPVPPVPPNEPVEVSPPEVGADDGGDTVPFPIDEPPDGGFPFGEPCVQYIVTATFTSPSFPDGLTQSLPVSGRVIGTVEEPSNSNPGSTNYAVQGEELDPITGICNVPVLVSFVLSPEPGTFVIDNIVEP